MLTHALATGMLAASVLVAQQPQAPVEVGALHRFQRPLPIHALVAKRFERNKDRSQPNPETIRLGLDWLARAQDETGCWEAVAGGEASVAVTGLAMLALLGDGNTLRAGPHKGAVKKGTSWLRDRQSDAGAFAKTTGPHVLASLAMTECYSISAYRLLFPTAQKGINHLARLQHADGAWLPDAAADHPAPALTLWGISALRVAEQSMLTVPSNTLSAASRWMNTPAARGLPETGLLGSAPPAERLPELHDEQTSANALARFWIGSDGALPSADVKTLERAAKLLRSWQQAPGARLSMLKWLYSSEALFHAGDDAAVARIAEALVVSQVTEGEDEGSWEPIGVWGEAGGRAWTTALAVLTLQTPTRYTRGLVRDLEEKRRGR